MNKTFKIILSIWIGFFGLSNLIWYFGNTFLMISQLKWGIFMILLTIAGPIWIFLVPSCWYACFGLIAILWADERKIKLWVYILIPLILSLLVGLLGKGLYPVVVDESTREIYIRMIPLI